MSCGLGCELRAYLEKFLQEGKRFLDEEKGFAHYSLWRAIHDLSYYLYSNFERHCSTCENRIDINEVIYMSAIRDKKIFGTVEFDIDGQGSDQSATFSTEFSCEGKCFMRNTLEYFGLDDANVAELVPVFDEFLSKADALPESTRYANKVVIEEISYETLVALESAAPDFYSKLVALGQQRV